MNESVSTPRARRSLRAFWLHQRYLPKTVSEWPHPLHLTVRFWNSGSSGSTSISSISPAHTGHGGRRVKPVDTGLPLTGGSATELSATGALLTAGDQASCASQSGNSETIRTSGADRRLLTMPLRLRIATYSQAQRPALYAAHDLGRSPCGNVGFGGNCRAGDQEIVAARERTACCFEQHSTSPSPKGMLATARSP